MTLLVSSISAIDIALLNPISVTQQKKHKAERPTKSMNYHEWNEADFERLEGQHTELNSVQIFPH